MKKSEQIRALEHEVDRLARLRDLALDELMAERAKTARLRAEAERSFREVARHEFHRRWDWLLEAVGL